MPILSKENEKSVLLELLTTALTGTLLVVFGLIVAVAANGIENDDFGASFDCPEGIALNGVLDGSFVLANVPNDNADGVEFATTVTDDGTPKFDKIG